MNQPKITQNKFALWAVRLLIVMLCCVFSWNAAGKLLTIVQLYLDKPDYVMSIIKQSDELDYENNAVLKSEISATIDNVLSYALDYQLTENTKFSFTIVYNINSEIDRTQKQIDSVKEVLPYQIENSIINADFVEKGFVDLTENPNGQTEFNGKRFDAQINSERIEQYYIAQRDELIEGYKSIDEAYHEISSFLGSLEGVNFAVVDRKNDAVISNFGDDDEASLLEFFDKKEHTAIIRGGEHLGTMSIFDDYIDAQAENFDADFDAYISFDSFEFNETCKQIGAECSQLRGEILRFVLQAVTLMAASDVMIFLFVWLTRRQKNATRIGKIPAAICGIVLLALMIAAVYIVVTTLIQMLSSNTTESWITFSNDFPFAIIKLCAAANSIYTLGIFSVSGRRKSK